MPRLKFSEADLLATTQLEAGWYLLEVKSMSDWTPGSKDPNSMNIVGDFIVLGPKKQGVPIRTWFSEKNIGQSRDLLAPFLSTFTADGKLTPGADYEPKDTVGRQVEAYVSWDPQMKANSISEYRKPKQSSQSA